MGSFRKGWVLTGASWRALRAHSGLIAFPALGALALIVLVAPVAVPAAVLVDEGEHVPGIALLVVAAYLASFVATFFGVALATSAARALEGESFGVGQGLRAAAARLPAIAGWALLNATLTLLIRLIEQKTGGAGRLIGALGGAAWGVVTFLAIPVVAFEGLGPIAALKRSAQLFRERWGGQLVGMAAIGGAVLLLGLLPAIALIAIGLALVSGSGTAPLGVALVAAGLVLLGVAGLVAGALRQVFAVALYRYARDGRAIGGFSQADLEGAVRARRASPALRTA